ncbi:hypothetical protein AB205_0139050 [Aquarana catesbeiana]|uniref:Uncharacterized protein n=1 Tax=Aquarana catesbeiana TaxID=8400 RepID=A0A2G9SBL0_AQUCT|nr:hypothetical protein AB205_0139050 [Aquarana catesbeiana]
MIGRTPETLPSVEKFFGSSLSLSHISLSGTKVPPELLRAMLQGLCSNTHLQDVHLDLSSCEGIKLGWGKGRWNAQIMNTSQRN